MSGGDTIIEPDAAIRVAGENDPGDGGAPFSEGVKPFAVTDGILGNSLFVPVDLDKGWRRFDPHDGF